VKSIVTKVLVLVSAILFSKVLLFLLAIVFTRIVNILTLTYLTVVGQHDDARMCIAIALTAVRLGANIANHTEVLELNKQMSDGKLVLSGAKVKDRLTGMFRLNSNPHTPGRTCSVAGNG